MLYPEHVLMVVASTLSGGMDKVLRFHAHKDQNTNATCGKGSTWVECEALDAFVSPQDVLLPWIITLGWLVVLGMPTVVLRSRHKDQGLALLAWAFLQYLSLVVCCLFATDHPVITYAMTMHACIRLLTRLSVSEKLVGGSWWWGLRFLGVGQLLLWEVIAGFPVSIVRWGRSPSWDQGLSCAYLAHLAGCLIPDLVLFALQLMESMARSFGIRGDD